MQTWIALLRGINVGGHKPLPMKDFRALLDDLGYRDVATYIQSGNAVFRAPQADPQAIAADIDAALQARFGFGAHTFVLSEAALEAALAANPYPQGVDDPKSVHFYFLAEPAVGADLDALEAVRKANEAFTLTPAVFYLHAPDGIGRSKLAERVERHIPVPLTARNLRSVMKIRDLARALDG